jgi:ribosome-binding ATPase YchF (GTP1/OBG family)
MTKIVYLKAKKVDRLQRHVYVDIRFVDIAGIVESNCLNFLVIV